MQVPCPVPLQRPWSPVGYDVVEVRDPKAPANAEGPQAIPVQRPPEPARPSSPLGYRVNQVTEAERPPLKHAPKATPGPAPAPPKTPQPPRTNPVVLWGSIVGAGFVAVVVLLSMALSSGTIIPPETASDPPNEHVRTPEGHDLVIPSAAALPKAKPAKDKKEKDKEPALPPDVPCKECRPDAPARETYGTAVEFVRAPREAARIAADENKLTLLLHVSGNFEESKFT